jgi:hypothetical protein
MENNKAHRNKDESMPQALNPAEANRAVIEHYFAVLQGLAGDRDLADFFSDDVTWQVPRSNPHITPNPRVGHAAVMDLLHSGVGVYEAGSMAITLQPLIADQTRVAAQFSMQARLANGNPYRNDYCIVFTLRDGLICGVTEYLDTLAQDRQSA